MFATITKRSPIPMPLTGIDDGYAGRPMTGGADETWMVKINHVRVIGEQLDPAHVGMHKSLNIENGGNRGALVSALHEHTVETNCA